MEDPKYWSFMEVSSNEAIKFVKKIIEKGNIQEIYKERKKLLKTHFPEKVKINSTVQCGILSHTIDMWNSIAAVLVRCFNTEPSAFLINRCPIRGNLIYPLATLAVNHKIISNEAFHKLLNALPNSRRHISYRECLNTCETITTYNEHVFIKIDIRMNMTASGKQCQFNEFPVSFNLNKAVYK